MAFTALLISTLFLGISLYGAAGLLFGRKVKRLPLPPGPKGWPIVGNLADLPSRGEREWEAWLTHKDIYGPISSVTVLGTTIVLLHSPELAHELLHRRSAIYSSRPRLVFGGEMCGFENILGIVPYGEKFRTYRKSFHTALGTTAVLSRFQRLQEAESHRFLFRLLEKPQDLREHIRTEAGAIILKITYGYATDSEKTDPLVDLADRALRYFSAAGVPGAWAVDTLPILRYVPDWVPGAGFKKVARKWKKTALELSERPAAFVKKQMAHGQYEPSFLSSLYDNAGDHVDVSEVEAMEGSAASVYSGGADTTVSTLASFFLAMTLHPEVQTRAREEIDRVVGTARLPTMEDRDNLPYVDAVVTESFRWHPVAPLALPHATTADDICNGYLIPKGAVVIANLWWFTHDPDVYSNPSNFDPSRHLGPDACPDPRNFVFGYGRRRCPGRLLADSSVWLTIARTLAVFDIQKGINNSGDEIIPEVRFTPGLVSHPTPFRSTIQPRSPEHEALVRQVESMHPWEKSHADEL
ncbi:cytochrome P450 [Xylariomycetidae sp. FL2044]|nr:cytochrome P450 [Xylariomycetidae sp. FL2044]